MTIPIPEPTQDPEALRGFLRQVPFFARGPRRYRDDPVPVPALAVAAVPLRGAPAPGATLDPADVLLVGAGADEAPVRTPARHTRMRRLTAMPYFSFVPRG